jgi:iron complex transport system permease protein
LRLGDEAAEALGIDAKRMRLSMLIYTSLLTAGAVCFTGVIGFIGLVAPHLARILVGEDQRFMIPCACLTGAILLIVADTIGRTIVAPYILPVGIVTSFIGAPFFLYLILAKGKIYWQ